MRPDDPEKLLGGYAAGNLTPEERSRLFESALNDQTLFDALVDEEPLRELLSDPVAKARLRRSLEPAQRVPWFRQRLAWSLAGSFAVVVFVSGFVAWRLTEQKGLSRTEIAQVAVPAAPPPAALQSAAPPSQSGKVEEVPRAKLSHPAARAFRSSAETARFADQPALPEPPAVAQSSATPPAAVAQAVREADRREAERDIAPAARLAAGPAAKSEAARSNAMPGFAGRGVLSARADKRARSMPAVGIRAAETINAALPYHTVLRRDASGAWQPLGPDAPLSTGDALRLRIVSPQAGELQVRLRDIEGVWRPLLEPGVRIDPGAARTVPEAGEIVLQGEQQISITVTPDGPGPVLARDVTLKPR